MRLESKASLSLWQRYLIPGAGILWFTLLCVGFCRLIAYDAVPGAVAARPNDWPLRSMLTRDPSLPTLVMAVHPQCPCTRASLDELAHLLATSNGRVRTIVLFVVPSGVSTGWEHTDLWTIASAIPGVRLQRDPSGKEAALFGAETSGHCLLFSATGQKLFSGGITAGRAHEGDNAGEDALAALLNGHSTGITHTPVFGCSLITPEASK